MNEQSPFNLAEDGWFNIAAPGEWPHKPTGLVQVLDGESMDQIVKAFVEFKAAPNWPGILIDFDHQSLDADKPTVAAGWISDLQKRDTGLWAQVRWSDIGRKSIEGGRYRFISPVWKSSDCAKLDGDRIRPLKLMNCAVTNDPNIKGLFPLSNAAHGAAEFSPPPMPILPEPMQASLPPSALPKPPRIGMDAALFNRALHSRSPRAITNRGPLTREQLKAIHAKNRSRPSGQVSIGPAKTDSGAKSGQPIYSENSDASSPKATPKQQAFLLDAIARAKKAAHGAQAASAKTTNETLRAMRESLDKNNSIQKIPTQNSATPGKIPATAEIPSTKTPEGMQPDTKKQADEWKALGFGQDEAGNWKSEWELKREGYSLQPDGNWKKVPAATKTAEVNPGTTGYVPGSLAGTRYSGVSTWTPSFNNRARRSGILANYARNYDDDQRRAIFAWYAGNGRKSSGRDTAGRIGNLQSQIDMLEYSRPTKPDDPQDFSLIDVAEVKRQAMAEGVDSGEVLSRIAAAQSTNAERKSAWAAIKRKFRKEYKSKPARERAIGRYLDKLQSAYKSDMDDYVKANAKIDGKITELRAKIADEEVRGSEDVRKTGIKDTEKTQAELKGIERDRERESVRAQIAADKKAAKDKAEAERAARNPAPTAAELEQRQMQAVLKAERVYGEANKLAQSMAISGRIESAMEKFPRMDWTAIDAEIAAIRSSVPNPSPLDVKDQNAEIARTVSAYFQNSYPAA